MLYWHNNNKLSLVGYNLYKAINEILIEMEVILSMQIKSDVYKKISLKKNLKMQKVMKFIYSLLFPLFIVFAHPLGMDLNQSIILGTLVLVLTWWTTGIVNRTHASIFLLVIFGVFGMTPLKEIFKFPLSSNFYMIALSFLLSQGIVNSNAANRFSNFILNKYGNTPYKLIFMSFVFSILLIFIIPQTFSRVILLSSIYQQFFKNREIPDDTKEVLYFSIFVAAAITCMTFINGDIILNYSVTQFAGISMGWAEWAKYMTVPSLLTTLATGITFVLIFRKKLKNINLNLINSNINMNKISNKEKSAIIIMAVVILLWMTEPLHSINSAIIALLGTLAMFGFKIIEVKDFKSLNFGLLIFLTSAFAIGSVMNRSGVANIIYSSMMDIFPSTFSNTYLIILIVTVMALHMLLGSSITTLSVVIPVLIQLTNGIIDPIPLSLLVYVAINIHFILPFHNITIMVGAGNNYYSNKTVIRYGMALTILVFVAIFGFYIPWWKFLNLL